MSSVEGKAIKSIILGWQGDVIGGSGGRMWQQYGNCSLAANRAPL